MSHLTERKEKNCLNCNATVQGRYCQVCGQENIVPQDSFGHLVLHFIYDITHFDGKFFHTLKYLVFKPGFLSKEYIAGRRMRYLNPVRMYVFTSALFFLVFFAMKSENAVKFTGNEPLTQPQRDSLIAEIREEIIKDPADSSQYRSLAVLLDSTRKVLRLTDLMDEKKGFSIIGTWGGDYRNVREYDSIQHALPEGKRDGWLKRAWNKKAFDIRDKYGRDPEKGLRSLSDAFMHRLPYLLFLSLPLFALSLKLLYLRNKKVLYAGHAIYSIHHYIFSFIILLLLMVFDTLEKTTWKGFGVITALLIVLWPVHLLLSMKKFYGQGWWKTIGKMILLNLMGLVTILVLFALFVLFSIFQL